jgi:hypothetical protein
VETYARNSHRVEPFTYQNVSFEILCEGRFGTPGIGDDLAGAVEPGRAYDATAHIVCSVRGDPSLGDRPSRPMPAVAWSDDHADVEGANVRATITRLEPRLYVASGRVGPSLAKIRPLLDALAAAVLAAEAV